MQELVSVVARSKWAAFFLMLNQPTSFHRSDQRSVAILHFGINIRAERQQNPGTSNAAFLSYKVDHSGVLVVYCIDVRAFIYQVLQKRKNIFF